MTVHIKLLFNPDEFKNRPNCSPTHFWSKLMHNFITEKSSIKNLCLGYFLGLNSGDFGTFWSFFQDVSARFVNWEMIDLTKALPSGELRPLTLVRTYVCTYVYVCTNVRTLVCTFVCMKRNFYPFPFLDQFWV
jgi:hypothetical protein